MTLAAEGDDVAFQALVRRVGPAILTVTTGMFHDRAAAEEAFVDVVAKLWTGRRTYRAGLPLRPWLMAIAANTCREHLRQQARRRAIGMLEFDDAAAPVTAPDDGSFADDHSAELRAAIARLPDRQRETLVLRVWGELAYEHVAEALGVSEATARSNMHHALRSLRDMLRNLEHFGDKQPAATIRSLKQ
jgi:RNA polymerase sigma-70 factor (ECF subfamily)